MKLYLLRPMADDPAWDPWYDKAFGFVVRAKDETEARQLAQEESGDEAWKYNFGSEPWRKPLDSWLSSDHSTCVELTSTGEAEVIIRDFASA